MFWCVLTHSPGSIYLSFNLSFVSLSFALFLWHVLYGLKLCLQAVVTACQVSSDYLGTVGVSVFSSV